MSTKLLSKVADVLEAVATENEKQAAEIASLHRQERAKALQPVVNKLASVTGETKETLEAKLASADSGLLEVISKLAGDSEFVDIGGPSTEKSASAGVPETDRAYADFGNWIVRG
jgi:hypothetical protein